MESSSAPVGTTRRREPTAVRTTQIGLLIASLGAFLVIFNLFGLGIVGIFLALGGAVLALPGGIGKGWYYAVALGAVVTGVSRLIAEGNEVLGGWLAVFGSVAVLIGAVLGFPGGDED
jgi:hypothetical protein